jgi:benzodiazapine receptor
VKEAVHYFLAQLSLNFLWSILFFGLKSPATALVDITLLWILIAMTMKHFRRLSQNSFYLLVPYLFWVSFALVLNLAIVVLN